MKTLRQWRQLLIFGLLLVTIGVVLLNRVAILDWERLRGYTPPSTISQLASQTTMTAKAQHLFYVNHPVLQGRTAFNQSCTNKSEQSMVLGCYRGDRQGIYLFQVTDSELDGVEQVTAAHEMLHQAYDRLSASERQHIDSLLEDYYQHDLTDQTIKDQIALYKKTEPTAVDNEMHSVFGTEVAKLPAALEQYYSQYFSNRATVAALYTKYQSAFTSRTQQIASDDAQLKTQKAAIDALQTKLQSHQKTLENENQQMTIYRENGQADLYNQLVAQYNTQVMNYNQQIDMLKQQINTYNALVNDRNAIAIQENDLQQALSSKSLSTTTTQ